MSQHFTKVNGGFERKLSPEMIAQYFASQSSSRNPLSPIEFAAQQSRQGGQLPTDSMIPFQPGQIQQAPQTPQESAQLPQESAQSAGNYADTFNNVMLEILKKAQGVDNVELLKRKRALERASLDRASEITPEELRTLSPSQQSTIRSGNVRALSSEIDENAYLLSKAEAQIDNFYKAFEVTSKLGAEFAEKMPLPEKVLESFVTALQQRPISDWNSIIAGLSDKHKSEVLAKVDYSNITEDKTFQPTATEPLSVSDQQKVTEATIADKRKRYELEQGLELAQDLMTDPELSSILGPIQQFTGGLVGESAYTLNKLTQLKNQLALAIRAKLKGQGTITDQEQKMLEWASSAISRNISPENMKKEIQKAINFFNFELSLIESDSGESDPLGIL